MKKHLQLGSILLLGLGSGQVWAQANPGASLAATFLCTAADTSESAYEIWLYNEQGPVDTQWAAAQGFAETRGPAGQANLAVFLDKIEEDCVLAGADALGLGVNQQLWIGLFQEEGSAEPAAGWTWVTGETLATAPYVNWADGEPNNVGAEDHGTIGRFGYVGDLTTDDTVGWNDELQTRPSMKGFAVEVSRSSPVTECLEDEDGVPPGQTGVGGCNKTGAMNNEISNALADQLDGKVITQFLVQSKVSARTSACNSGQVAQDPRVDEFGNVIDVRQLDLSEMFEIPANQAFLDSRTYFSPCGALIEGSANFTFADFVDIEPFAAFYQTTQFPESVDGMFDLTPRITFPLNTDPDSPNFQPDLQFVEQASYQPHDRFILPEELGVAFTSEAFNPARKKTPQFSFFMLNTREICRHLPPSLKPEDGFWYFKAVLVCKAGIADEFFHNLDEALLRAAPDLVSPDLHTLRRDLTKARRFFRWGYWSGAERKLMKFREGVLNAEWIIDDDNSPGQLIMRIDNMFFRINQLQESRGYLYPW